MSIYFDHNQTLEQVKSAQYFDITIIGISECQIFLLCRYTKILGFIHRNFSLQSRETKEVAYKTLVCWNTQPSLKSIYSGQTEKVQKIAARWTCRRWQNMSYWRDTGWIAVASTGSPARACFSCILPQKSVQMLDTLKYLTSAPGLRQIRASHDSQHPSYTNALKYFFFFIPLRNTLPPNVVAVDSFNFPLEMCSFSILLLFVNSLMVHPFFLRLLKSQSSRSPK